MNNSTTKASYNKIITEPPDIGSMKIEDTTPTTPSPSFLQTLISNKHPATIPHIQQSMNYELDLSDESLHSNQDDDIFIPITTEDKYRLYTPWKYSVIVKVFGRKIAHHLLQSKLLALWNPTEDLPLIDLGSDFFLIKFQKEENMLKSLHGGPWFVLNHFLSVRQWEPKFIASSIQLTYSSIWVSLPELPTEFYDEKILQKVGSKLGQLLKVDACTSSTTRGKYARICIEVPLEKPLKSHILIGHHKQMLLYEGLNLLCTRCGRFGHTNVSCLFTPQQSPTQPACNSSTSTQNDSTQQTEWKTVSFSKKSLQHQNNSRNTVNIRVAQGAAKPGNR
ncbi:PREDICTED: uncharacterized protein LOC109212674 [Nicotiana attenuata]|uniref:uncharacterized protein LOC109212674 n=1 Tax=Nicotiana attenuata TaxID=49451 RepID=UPI0009046D69|nr:PREDICTED: uncharacterized protein LOC109212674 [Nicotiana attenuata]